MTTQIGAPFIPPDNTLLSINTSTGAMQLKPGTQGDILYAGASGVWAKLGAGTSGQALTTQGAGANPAWMGGTMWTKDQNDITPSGTNGTITLASSWKQVLLIFKNIVMSGADTLMLSNFNSDGASHYSSLYIANTTVTNPALTTFTRISSVSNTFSTDLMVMIGGLSPTNASGTVPISVMTQSQNGSAGSMHFGGSWQAGSAVTLSTIRYSTVGGAVTFSSGTIEVWGRN